jgi:hypothetical protein
MKKVFKSWVVGKKVVSIRSKSACKSDPSFLVHRVFSQQQCEMSHNSSRFEIYGLTKLKDPHMKA